LARAASSGEEAYLDENQGGVRFSLYKIMFCSKALVWESILLLVLPPPAKPTLLQYYCTTIAHYATLLRAPFCMPYTIHSMVMTRVNLLASTVTSVLARAARSGEEAYLNENMLNTRIE